MPPLVSIIIPCLNAAPWLAETFESCLKQTYPVMEIIFVDNGSTDASWEIAKRFECSKVKLLRCARKSASAARNDGLSNAQGEFIQYLDADDLLDPKKIAIQIARLKEASADYITSGAWTRFKEETDKCIFRPDPVWKDCQPQEYFLTSWRRGGDLPVFSWLTPRDIVRRAGPWNETLSFNDDGEYFCRVILASKGILFCPEAKGYYRSVLGSLSSQGYSQGLGSHFQSVELSIKHLLEFENSLRTRSAAADFLQIFAWNVYPEFPQLAKTAEIEIVRLGGSNIQLRESIYFNMFAYIFGWKAARRLQFTIRKLRRV